MAPSSLADRFVAWRGMMANLKLVYRDLRTGALPFTPENALSFELALFAADVEATKLITDAAKLVSASADLVADAVELMDRRRPPAVAEPLTFADECEVGEIVADAQRHRQEVRDRLEPAPFVQAEVYQPEADRGWLKDMAVPASPDRKVLVFPGVFHTRGAGK